MQFSWHEPLNMRFFGIRNGKLWAKKEKTVKQEMKKKLTMGEKADRIIHRKM